MIKQTLNQNKEKTNKFKHGNLDFTQKSGWFRKKMRDMREKSF